MPVVARDVDDRRDGNEWKFVTRSHASFRSGVVGNGRIYIYIYCSIRDYERLRFVLLCWNLSWDTPSSEFPFRRNGAGDGRLIHRKRKIGRIKGLVMNFVPWIERIYGIDIRLCSCACVYVCVQPLFSLFFFSFFDKWWPIIFFPPGREGIGVLTQLVWGEVWSKDLCCARVIK